MHLQLSYNFTDPYFFQCIDCTSSLVPLLVMVSRDHSSVTVWSHHVRFAETYEADTILDPLCK